MKKMNKKGFTLMEMLIVIAIIAILIAIAIPTFTSALEKSRQRTDMANVRSLKSLAVADYMAEGDVLKGQTTAVDVYLLEGGQDFTTDDSKDVVLLEAKWADETYGKGDKVQLTIDCGDNGKISNPIPDIPGVAS